MKNKTLFLLLSILLGAIWSTVATPSSVLAQSDVARCGGSLRCPKGYRFAYSDSSRSDRENESESESESESEIPTRSYVGLGGNIGISGEETALGDGGFSLLGRTAFTKNISLHTSTVFGDDNLDAFALTFGVPIRRSSDSELELLYPFIGGGIAVEDLLGDSEVDALITTGADIPISKRVTGTARINVSLAEDDTDVGLLLGAGYNFSILELFILV